MRGVYGVTVVLASVVAACSHAVEQAEAPLQSRYDESRSVAAGEVSATVAKAGSAAAVVWDPMVMQAGDAAAMSKADAARLVEQYFTGINTLKAEFTQRTSGEAFTQTGVFYLKKPRQFLWRYETPTQQKVVGTGTTIYYHDEKTNQVTQLPSSSGMTKLFTAGRLDLAREGVSIEAVHNGVAETVVTLGFGSKGASLGAEELRRLDLHFSKNPLTLRRLEAVDVTGAVTTIVFDNLVKNAAVDRKLFDFVPPHYRRN